MGETYKLIGYYMDLANNVPPYPIKDTKKLLKLEEIAKKACELRMEGKLNDYSLYEVVATDQTNLDRAKYIKTSLNDLENRLWADNMHKLFKAQNPSCHGIIEII